MAQAIVTPTVWRVDEPVRRLAAVVAVFFVVVAAGLTASGIALPGALLGWVLAGGVLLCVWRWYLVPYVALSAESLVVQGAFSSRSVRYGTIRAVTPGPMGLQVVTAKGSMVRVWAIQRSARPGSGRRDSRADRVAAAIMDEVARASAS